MYKKPTRKVLVLGLIGITGIMFLVGLWFASIAYRPSALKGRIEAYLSDQLESEVTLQSLEGSFFPRVVLQGGGLVIRQKGRTDVPPLVTVAHFQIHASLKELMVRPRHVSEVLLQGTEVNIPPGDDSPTSDPSSAAGAPRADRTHDVVIDRFEAPNTVLTLIPRKPNKPPKVFTIQHLVMERVGRALTVPFVAVLTNPVPKGSIETSGLLGPWDVAQPWDTKVAGKYVFANADLNTITGLAGILSSEGSFVGPINKIHVEGTTSTPDFQVDAGGKAVPLTTKFAATVDGSDGDTLLDSVEASFLGTTLTAKGAVIGLEGVPGRKIDVEVTDLKGRVEDLLTMAMDSPQPLLRGAVQLKAHLQIPSVKAKVLDKMNLRGSFGVSQAKFTDKDVQAKIVGLSRHGRGKKADDPLGEVMSNLRGQFVFDRAVATFSDLRFGVPGANVRLAGHYGVRSEDIDFHGQLTMEATLSQAVGGGWKSFLLKAVDPFFRKNGSGTVLPIKITGSRTSPKFGLELFGGNKAKKK